MHFLPRQLLHNVCCSQTDISRTIVGTCKTKPYGGFPTWTLDAKISIYPKKYLNNVYSAIRLKMMKKEL